MVVIFNRIFDIEHGRHRSRNLSTIVDVNPAVRTIRHNLQRGRAAALQADADQLVAQPLNRGGDNLCQTPVNGGLGDQLGHIRSSD